MPAYKVKKDRKGFYNGVLYGAGTNRSVLYTEKPFTKKDIPSWVEPEPLKDGAKKSNRKPTKKPTVTPDFTAAESGPAKETTVETL